MICQDFYKNNKHSSCAGQINIYLEQNVLAKRIHFILGVRLFRQ